jgi:hypothetical protein
MLEIRPIAWFRFNWLRNLNPWKWKSLKEQAQHAGLLADWMHNLAMFSALDFEGFDEELFWNELERMRSRFTHLEFRDYRRMFEHNSEIETRSTFATNSVGFQIFPRSLS